MSRPFSLSDLPSELILKILTYLSSHGYSNLLTLDSKVYSQAVILLHQKAYSSRIFSRMSTTVNTRLYVGLLSCLYKPEWDLGALRLFVIDYEKLLNVLKTVQDPSDHGFECVSSCFLDYQELLDSSCKSICNNEDPNNDTENMNINFENTENNGDTQNTNTPNEKDSKNKDIASILRYSERMDLGTFLVKVNLPSQSLLLRCKPVGKSTRERLHGDGKLVVWDEHWFGRCEVCDLKLSRLQVCEACKVKCST